MERSSSPQDEYHSILGGLSESIEKSLKESPKYANLLLRKKSCDVKICLHEIMILRQTVRHSNKNWTDCLWKIKVYFPALNFPMEALELLAAILAKHCWTFLAFESSPFQAIKADPSKARL